MSDREVTADLMARLQRHYIKPGELMPGGMFLPEVTLGSRRADALYVGFFQSRGKFLVGHEVKASRADWLHELDQPAKAEVWVPNCHEWWIVAPSTEVVRPAELPEGWGLMVPGRSRTRMDVVVKATRYPERVPSWEATHALVQKADSLRMQSITEARTKAQEAAWAEIEKQVAAQVARQSPERDRERDRERAEAAEAKLAVVEELLGLKIVDGRPWDLDQASVEDLRRSFAAWVKADRATADAITHRVTFLKGIREDLERTEAALAALKAEVAS